MRCNVIMANLWSIEKTRLHGIIEMWTGDGLYENNGGFLCNEHLGPSTYWFVTRYNEDFIVIQPINL